MFDLKEYKIYNELITLKYMLSKEKSFKNYDKIIDEIIELCNSRKKKNKRIGRKRINEQKNKELEKKLDEISEIHFPIIY